MIKYKQLFRHDPKNGTYGDCDRTVIACLLDMEPKYIPHFWNHIPDENAPQKDIDKARECKNEWLERNNLKLITTVFNGKDDLQLILDSVSNSNPGEYYILAGESKNGCNHVVICKDGEIVHDPSLDESGIIGPCIPTGFYEISFLARGI